MKLDPFDPGSRAGAGAPITDDADTDKLMPMEQRVALINTITETEFAALIGVKERTVRVWRSEGTGPDYISVGRRTMYNIEDVKEWLRRQRCVPVAGRVA